MDDKYIKTKATRVIPKISSLDILDNNIFHNLNISENISTSFTDSYEPAADMMQL